MKRSHLHRPLAHNRTCQIEYCAECDVMHVTVGPVTLRLQPQASRQVCSALAEALERLSASDPTTPWVASPSLLPS